MRAWRVLTTRTPWNPPSRLVDPAAGSAGGVLILDQRRVRRFNDTVIQTVMGNGLSGLGAEGVAAASAQLSLSQHLGRIPDGLGFLLSDSINNRVRWIRPNFTVVTLLGTGSSTYNGNLAPLATNINAPQATAWCKRGVTHTIYVSENSHRIRQLQYWPSPFVTVVAGTGTAGYGDNVLMHANETQISGPRGIVCGPDTSTTLFTFADSGNSRLRAVLLNGSIVTVAGTGVSGRQGDGGPALQAQVGSPLHLAVDTQGTLYFTDISTHVRPGARDGVE
jgi:hypothetical protein